MPETPEQLYARAAGALRMPLVEEWDTFPFEGTLRPRPLRPPDPVERPRAGEEGVDCPRCAAPDAAYLWTDERWRGRGLAEPTGLPVMVLLEPRAHFDAPGDLPDELAAELGVIIARVERAVRSVGEIGRVLVCRFGEGLAHLHWWFIGRPARLPQVGGSLAALWDDVLPPTPEDVWRSNLEQVARALARG